MIVTAATMISTDIELLEWCVVNARKRAGVEHTWLVIGLESPSEVGQWCLDNDCRFVNLEMEPNPDQDPAIYLRNLYKGWNALYEYAETPWVARMGADQFFSQNWLRNLMECVPLKGERAVYHCYTVESETVSEVREASRRKNNEPHIWGHVWRGRHDLQPWGDSWQEFKQGAFDSFANDLVWRFQHEKVITAEQSDLFFFHPTRGSQLRPDGASWLQTKALWEEFGPMPDTVVEGVSGDVAYMDALYDAGVPGFLVPISATYHVGRGASGHEYKEEEIGGEDSISQEASTYRVRPKDAD